MSDKQPSQSSEATFEPLTDYQLSARQAGLGKLTNFTGAPEEWPLFYELYRYSTRSCGFTNTENVLRLRQHLKGKAFEAVRYLLIYPSTVDTAVETLKMRFGKPEQLCVAMIQKMRQLEAPQFAQTRTVMIFGFAVKDMCRTIESTGRPEYLYDFMLLNDLVAKLPRHYKLEWFEHRRSLDCASQVQFSQWIGKVAEAILMQYPL